ncbi:EAL domain-containing protein [Neptunomonas sp.]|uniref:EAL domain-containing protein n=1 Tax=Neptunomonas sp. TaxID=1971898 RepID=UPI0025DBE576|nr:EAL domain-containing protein [Neptunomonas sp.]
MARMKGAQHFLQPIRQVTSLNTQASWATFKTYLVPMLISLTLTVLISCSFIVEQIEDEKQSRRQALRDEAILVADWLDQNLSSINNVLFSLETFHGSCDENTLFKIRSILFTLPQVVEMGFVDRYGTLLCTSWEKIRHKIQVSKPVDSYGLRFLGPLTVEFMLQPTFVLARTTDDKGEVNALFRISWLKDQLRNHTSTKGFTALIDSKSGVPLAINGSYSLPLKPTPVRFPIQSSRLIEGMFDNGNKQSIIIIPLLTLPGLSVAISEDQEVLYQGVNDIPHTWYLEAFTLFIFLYMSSAFFQRQLTNPTLQLKKAIRNREFFSVFQPLVDSRTRQLIGVEALVRWNHPVDGLRMPLTFLPQAEQSGLLMQMTSMQLKQSAKDLAPFIKHCPNCLVHINIAACHLLSEDSLNEFFTFREQIPGLVLEITEDTMLELESSQIRQALERLDRANIPIAIDDFGTGYCGLSYLRSLPVSILKADKSFIASMGTDSVNADVLQTIINLAKTLKLTTVAEGVETDSQCSQLQAMNVDIQQGWLHGKPMSADALSKIFNYDGTRRNEP